MGFYKTIKNDYLIMVGKNTGGTEITEAEYNELLSIIHNRPIPQSGYDYKLKADTLTWELVELPEPSDIDEDATEQDYISALNDLGVVIE